MSDFDFSALDRLAADLGEVPKKTAPFLRKALNVSSIKVKNSWRDKLKGSISFKHLPGAVNYDILTFRGFGVSLYQSEIGFDKGRPQGALGNISEYGTATTPPSGFGHAALQENQEDFQYGIEKAVGDALKAAGL